jgi:DNA-binding IscR family transcriptional regulator
MRAVEGPLANVRGTRPETVSYDGAARGLRDVWIAVRANLRSVLEAVTLADLAQDELPPAIAELTRDPEAWVSH